MPSQKNRERKWKIGRERREDKGTRGMKKSWKEAEKKGSL